MLSRYRLVFYRVVALSTCVLSRYRVVALSRYRVIALSRYRVIALSRYRVIALSRYRVVALSRCRVVALSRYRLVNGSRKLEHLCIFKLKYKQFGTITILVLLKNIYF